MSQLCLLILSLSAFFFIGCGPSERELELERELKQLKQAEQKRLDEQKKQFKLNGSVFVATRGGENIKLGLAPVAAITKEEFDRYDLQRIQLVEKFIADNTPVYQQAKVEFLTIKEKLDLLKTQYNIAEEELRALRKSLDNNWRITILSPSTYSSPEVYTYDEKAYAQARNIRSMLNSKISSVNEIAKKYNDLRDSDDTRDPKNLMNTIAELAKDEINTYYRTSAADLIELAQKKTKTNADGEFSLNLTRGIDFVIAAFADRSVGDSTEKYNWFIPYTTPLIQGDDTILISNDTMASDTSPVTSGLYVFKASPYLGSLSLFKSYKLELN